MCPSTARRIPPERLIAPGLLVAFAALYWFSVPDSFNTVFRNERFFGSDGEFITRQFAEGETFTHNDHLLYHVSATVLHRAAPWIPGLAPEPVAVHKVLSVLAGAAGVSLLYVFGRRYGGRRVPALLLAVLVGGTASYWFFSATIDTYLPSVCISILALGTMLECARTQRASTYLWLGAVMGVGFLARTDGFLLAPLAGVALASPRDRLRRGGACLATALLVGGLGYAVLARQFYDVAFRDVPSFALKHQERKRVLAGKWGRIKNLRWKKASVVLANHFVYSVILPDMHKTRSANVLNKMATHRYGTLSLGVLLAFGGWLGIGLVRLAAGSAGDRRPTERVLLLVALLWLALRLVFYTWWDPLDPFLFAVTNLPALWLLCTLFLAGPRLRGEPDTARIAAAGALAAVVWIHNAVVLIGPLQAF